MFVSGIDNESSPPISYEYFGMIEDAQNPQDSTKLLADEHLFLQFKNIQNNRLMLDREVPCGQSFLFSYYLVTEGNRCDWIVKFPQNREKLNPN